MTIRSIDMQVLVQKVGDVAKIQQAEKSDHNNRQQQFAQQILQQTETNSKTVSQNLRSEATLIRDKQEEEEKRKKKKRQNQLEEDPIEEELLKDKHRGQNIDIKA